MSIYTKISRSVCCFYVFGMAILLCSSGFFIFERFYLKLIPQPDTFANVDAIANENITSDLNAFAGGFDADIQLDDPRLLHFIKNSVLNPPSEAPYNLHRYDFNISYYASDEFYKRHAYDLLSETKSGFFIEAGAFNGEDMSNTLWLEVKRGWTGLLIEPDISIYKGLRSKNRKAWSANSCLSVEKYPKVETFSFVVNMTSKSRGMSVLSRATTIDILHPNHQENNEGTTSYNMTCFPLGSFLLAMEITKVDLFSLDVENIEDKILANFDFERFDVQVIFIEWLMLENAHLLKRFLENRSYIFVENTSSDFVFVRSGTPYHEIALRKNLIKPFKVYQMN